MKHEVGWILNTSLSKEVSAAFSRMTLIERANSLFSTAQLHFLVKDASLDGKMFSAITDLFIKQKDEPFQFWLESASGGKTKKWNHVVVRLHLSYSQNDEFDPMLTVTTMDQMAHMNRATKNRAHTRHEGVISSLVESIIQENKLTADVIEPTGKVAEFGVLRQCYLTDYQFILSHLIPRSSGSSGSGFRLFTKDGKKVCFQTLSYKAKDCTIEPEAIKKIDEFIDCYEVHKAGGHDVKASTLNPFDKKVVQAESSGEDGQTGSTGPSWSNATYLNYPVYSKEALDAITKAHQRGLVGGSFPFELRILGADKVGKEKLALEFPMKIKLAAGTKYRGRDDQSGFLEEVVHKCDTGVYDITLRCSRGKINV